MATASHTASGDDAPGTGAAGAMTFRDCPRDCPLRVTAVRLSADAAFRLGEMGLRVGTTARVTHRAAFGGRVVAVDQARLALDEGTARSIHVTPVETPS